MLYKPNDAEHPFEAGQLLHCSYSLNNNKYVDLRLPQSHNQARINNPKNWETIYDGHQYDCNKSRWACEFKLTHKIKQD